MVLLSHLLTGNAGGQCLAAANGSRSGNTGGIVHYSEAVHQLLHTYATEQAFTKALYSLDDIYQNKNKIETSYDFRLNNTTYRSEKLP